MLQCTQSLYHTPTTSSNPGHAFSLTCTDDIPYSKDVVNRFGHVNRFNWYANLPTGAIIPSAANLHQVKFPCNATLGIVWFLSDKFVISDLPFVQNKDGKLEYTGCRFENFNKSQLIIFRERQIRNYTYVYIQKQ